jgi:hypothetical protein
VLIVFNEVARVLGDQVCRRLAETQVDLPLAHRPFLTDELDDVFHCLVLTRIMLDGLGPLSVFGVGLSARGYHNSHPELEETVLLSLLDNEFFARFRERLQADEDLARDQISTGGVNRQDLLGDVGGRPDLLGEDLDLPLLDLLEPDFLDGILHPFY